MFIAGPYNMTYGGQSIGIVQDGFELFLRGEGQQIVGHNFGSSVQDCVYTGGQVFLSFILQEYDTAAGASSGNPFWPWATTPGMMGVPGVLGSSKAQQLILTKITGTNATPSTYTFGNIAAQVLSGGVVMDLPQDVRMMLAARHKQIPFRFRAYPYTKTNVTYWWEQA